MPQDAAYRKHTERIVNDRLKVVQTVSVNFRRNVLGSIHLTETLWKDFDNVSV